VFNAFQSLLVHEALWIAANGMIRIAAYQLLLRTFTPLGTQFKLRWFIVLLLSLSIVYSIASILEVLLVCRPLAAQWNAAAGTCGNQKISFLAIEGAGLILDLPLFLIPAKMIAELRITARKKMTLIFIFQMGSMSVKSTQFSGLSLFADSPQLQVSLL
jgi:hypothetical protein